MTLQRRLTNQLGPSHKSQLSALIHRFFLAYLATLAIPQVYEEISLSDHFLHLYGPSMMAKVRSLKNKQTHTNMLFCHLDKSHDPTFSIFVQNIFYVILTVNSVALDLRFIYLNFDVEHLLY